MKKIQALVCAMWNNAHLISILTHLTVNANACHQIVKLIITGTPFYVNVSVNSQRELKHAFPINIGTLKPVLVNATQSLTLVQIQHNTWIFKLVVVGVCLMTMHALVKTRFGTNSFVNVYVCLQSVQIISGLTIKNVNVNVQL